MWTLNNQTPFAAERAFIRDLDGAEVWVVMLAATYGIAADGPVTIADVQLPVCLEPDYLGEPGRSSLRCDSDLVLSKRTTDVLLHGTAHAGERGPTKELSVSLAVGDLRKVLWVLGDRTWVEPALGLTTPPRPFVSMPLTYERAYGGVDPEQLQAWCGANPAGRGFADKASRRVGLPAPNIVYSSQRLQTVAGFGPIDRSWSPRARLAGTYDDEWEARRMPLLPEDFDLEFYQSAPNDQRPTAPLRGGEAVALTNMHPSGPLSFRLPIVRPIFVTQIGARRVWAEPMMHRVTFDTDAMQLQMVWHAALPCHHSLYELRTTHIELKRVV